MRGTVKLLCNLNFLIPVKNKTVLLLVKQFLLILPTLSVAALGELTGLIFSSPVKNKNK